MKYLLDTNICIYLIKKRPLEVLERFKSVPLGELGISTITLAELQYGVAKSAAPAKNGEALSRFLTPFAIVDFDADAAIWYGRVRARLASAGTPIGSMDMLIAAHALAHRYILVSNNTREFERVEGLMLENWAEPL